MYSFLYIRTATDTRLPYPPLPRPRASPCPPTLALSPFPPSVSAVCCVQHVRFPVVVSRYLTPTPRDASRRVQRPRNP
ncbi:hypothetical protein VTO73DRAFT_12882 [Trametes versicolor]